ncbi:MAG: PAS domain-containing protein [Blautia sp.]|jgi:PAS domain S-box-containing protein|uniref:hybrid sensor histidine kinase/response regulator n=1 Tax=Blautia sp. TaxID=1955243 RepID=UPI003D92FC73
MIREVSLLADQVKALMDNAPIAVCVSSADTYEILYANRLAWETFMPGADPEEKYCYQVAGFDRPCAFCRREEISGPELLFREYRHPANGRIYQLSGKIIDWNGKAAHIEYIQDITDRKREEEQSAILKKELQDTFSSIPCGLCVYRYDGTGILPVFHNPAFYEIMGYSEEHIRNVEEKTEYMGVHPDDCGALQEKILKTIKASGTLEHTYRVWNDRKEEYSWIHLQASVKSQTDSTKLLYAVYRDVSGQVQMEKELIAEKDKVQDIVNAISGGVAIYRVSDILETIYFSDGVPELSGYTVEEYHKLVKRDAVEMTYWEDTEMVIEKVQEVIRTHKVLVFEFRKQHRDGHIVWVRAHVKWIGEDKGCPLLHCVFHNISDLKETQLEMDHLVNSIPGGIASYRIEGERITPIFISDGVMALSGHTRGELEQYDAFRLIHEPDRERVLSAMRVSLETGKVLDVSYRIRHRDGGLVWIHLRGRRMDACSESVRFYAVFTGMSAEARLFQSIANDTADGIYVIGRDNYDLLYANESKLLFQKGKKCLGQKCYKAMYGKDRPCEFCTQKEHRPDGEEHRMMDPDNNRCYSVRFRETDWNGIPAYIKYVRDVTEEMKTQSEKERLEQYFQNVLKYLPGGVAVVRYEQDGRMIPEFLSEGFAEMTKMSMEEAWAIYKEDAMAGVHPDDKAFVNRRMEEYMAAGDGPCEIVYRLKTGGGNYVWVKNTLSLVKSANGEKRVYAGFHDMTKEREEKAQIRKQYNDLILQHYRTPGPNALIVGHCNITQNRILEILDYTDSDLLKTFGSVREEFFAGIAELVTDPDEKQLFLDTYLNAPTLAAFKKGDTEQIRECYVKLPKEQNGRYVQFKVNLVETPDTGGVTGILTVTDITEQAISERILRQLSVTSYDLVVDVDVLKDSYTVLTGGGTAGEDVNHRGCYSRWIMEKYCMGIVPRDKEHVTKMLAGAYMMEHLKRESSYSFHYSMTDEKGDVLTKNMTVSAVDLRLGRVCLARTDITDSVREQQSMLNVVAYTFELMAFIDVNDGRVTMYTRQTVLENLSPYILEGYRELVKNITDFYITSHIEEENEQHFDLDNMLRRLEEKPSGYDFVLPYQSKDGLRYKQVNVLWGDRGHRRVCMVRADVTDMLAAEREAKDALQEALALAEKANRAKSEFLSSMSHDIRTPMNAVIGMTSLALANLDEKERVKDCLQKISSSSKYLLSLINDILDMSKIERSKIMLNRMQISMPEMLKELSAMMEPQAEVNGLAFSMEAREIRHQNFYGDKLRINQILINILSNAIKFTPKGGRVEFLAEETDRGCKDGQVCYRFTISDTGIGMTEEFVEHIFEPFSRNTNTVGIEGTGLGLSITKGLVDLMDGKIWVKSRQNEGSVFCVEIICETMQGEAAVKQDGDGEPERQDDAQILTGRCFLVAEDNAINSEILCELLKMYGARSVVMTDGIQAVKEFQRAEPGTYDAVLMDIRMPRMNGYDAARAIRRMAKEDAGTIPIIAMTANAFAEDVQEALEAGMNAHVAKPIDVKILRDTLTGLLAGQTAGE